MTRLLPLLSLAFLVASMTADSVAQQDRAIFDAPLLTGGGRIDHLVDLDGDGDLDGIGSLRTSTANDVLVVWVAPNDAGRLVNVPVMSWSIQMPSLNEWDSAVGDINQDGKGDYVLGTANQVRVFFGTSPASVAGGFTFTITNGVVHAIVVADFTQDGWPDILVGSSVRLQLFVNNGGTGVTPGSFINIATSSDQATVGDVNGDATPDVIIVSGLNVRGYRVVGGTLFSQFSTFTGLDSQLIDSGDVDGDGDADIVAFGATQYRILRRVTPTAFMIEPAVNGGPGDRLVDVDGDGDLDGVCCGSGGPILVTNNQPSTFRITLNDGAGNFAPALSLGGLGANHLAGCVDIDGDGDLDLVAGRCVYYGNGSLLNLPPAIPPAAFGPGHDLDSDGDVDLGCTATTLMRNQADGTFTSATPLLMPAPGGTTWNNPTVLGDWDGDGDADMVVEHRAGSNLISMRLLLNRGGAFFDGGPATAAGVGFMTTVPGATVLLSDDRAIDVDGDGDLDCVLFRVVNSNPAFFSAIWFNQGGGSFVAGPHLPLVRLHAVLDLNGDGIKDLVTAEGANYAIRPGLLGPTLTFGPATPITLFPQTGNFGLDHDADRPAFADFDGDGDMDFLCATPGTGPAIYRVNNGSGNFQNGTIITASALSFGSSAGGQHLWTADIDADGHPDAIGEPVFESTGIQIYRPATNVVPVGSQFMGAGVQIIRPIRALVDVDGDGDLDIIADRLHLNRTIGPADVGWKAQRGVGTAGSSGIVPTLGAAGDFSSGGIAQVRLTGALSGTIGFFVVGVTAVERIDFPLPGLNFYTSADLALEIGTLGSPGIAGEGSWFFDYVVPPWAAGYTLRHQVFLYDPGASATASIAATGRLDIHYP